MKRKKIIALGLIAMAIASMSACGKTYDTPSVNTVSEDTADQGVAEVQTVDICSLVTNADKGKGAYPEDGIWQLNPMTEGVADQLTDVVIGTTVLDPAELFKGASDGFAVAEYLNQYYEFQSGGEMVSKNNDIESLKAFGAKYILADDGVVNYVYNFDTCVDAGYTMASNASDVELPADVETDNVESSIVLTVTCEYDIENEIETPIGYRIEFIDPRYNGQNIFDADPAYENLLYYADLTDGRKAMLSSYDVNVY